MPRPTVRPTVRRQTGRTAARRPRSERLTRLHLVGLALPPSSEWRSAACAIGLREVCGVEQVEDLGAELDVASAAEPKCFAITMSTCRKPGPWIELRSRLPNVPGAGVANAAGFRNSSPPSLMNGSTPGTRSGRRMLRELPPPGVLIDRHAIRRRVGEDVAGGVDDRRCRGRVIEHVDRQAAARVDDAADVPPAEHRLFTPACADAAAAAVRQLIEQAQVERVADVEVVVAVVVVEVARASRALLPAVSASFDPPVLPVLRPSVYCTFIDRPLGERGATAAAASRCSCRGRRWSCSRFRRTGSARP